MKVFVCAASALLTLAAVRVDALTTEESDSRPINIAPESRPIVVDSVDPRDGNLVIGHTDLMLPGNGGFDIAVTRYYSLKELSAGLTASYVKSYKWMTLGPGWTMRVAPRIVDDNNFSTSGATLFYGLSSFDKLCAGSPLISGNTLIGGVSTQIIFDGHSMPVLELPNGERQPLYSDGGGVATTANNWRVQCSGGVITAHSPDGVRYDFGALSANRMIGQYTLSMFPPLMGKMPPNRSVTYIDAVKATDTNGNWIEYQYTTHGVVAPIFAMPGSYSSAWPPGNSTTIERGRRPSAIVSSDGRSISFNYDATSGRLLSLSDSAGRTLRYEYVSQSSADLLSRVVRPDGTDWKYSYFPGGYQTGAYNQTFALSDASISSFKLSSLTYPTGGSVSYEYGYYNNQATITGSVSSTVEYSRGERVRKRSLSTGDAWQYSYSLGGAGQYDVTAVAGPEGTTTYRYMAAGYARATNIATPAYENNAWRVGQLMDMTLPDGSSEAYEWTPRQVSSIMRVLIELGQVRDERVWVADPLKRTYTRNGATYVTTFASFDAYGNPRTMTQSGPNGGQRTTTLSYLNDTSKWIIGKLRDEVSEAGSTTRSFDANGNVLSLTQNGVTSAYTYDSQGNVATRTSPRNFVSTFTSYKRGIPQSESHPDEISISRSVSDAGDVTSETNGNSHTRRYTYDGLGRVTSIDYPRGNDTTIVYTANTKTVTRGGLVESTVYDGLGRVASQTVGGITTTYAYDALGRRSFESHPGQTIGTSYQYDALNRITRVTNADSTFRTHTYGAGNVTVRDERGNYTTYNYRAYGDPDASVLIGIVAADPAANMTITRGADDLVREVTQAGITRTFGYDARKYLVSEQHPETGTTTYGRDAAGNMTSKSLGGKTTTFVHDGHNRLRNVSYSDGTPSVSQLYSRSHKLLNVQSSTASRVLGYDENDNLTSELLIIGSVQLIASYGYSGNDEVTSITYPVSNRTVSYTLDALGRPTQVSGYINSVTYWPSGLPRQVDYANGIVTSYEQNSRLWASSFSTRKGGTFYINSAYSYDGVGNLTGIRDSADAVMNRTLGYDSLNRLTSAAGPWGGGAITYDGAGNIRTQGFSDFGLVYSFDAQNRVASVSGSRPATYSYDSYGNISAAAGTSYSYDGVPNLRCVSCGTPNQIQYAYDGLGKRVSVVKAGVTSYELYATNGDLLVEYTPSQANKLIEYIHLGGKRVAQRVSDSRPPTPITYPRSAVANRNGVTLSVTVGDAATGGTVTFMEGGAVIGTAYVIDGRASLDVQGMTLGNHTITAIYSGDSTHSGNTVVFPLKVIDLAWLPAVLNLLQSDEASNEEECETQC